MLLSEDATADLCPEGRFRSVFPLEGALPNAMKETLLIDIGLKTGVPRHEEKGNTKERKNVERKMLLLAEENKLEIA